MSSSQQKWKISVFSALIFALCINAKTYKLTDNLLNKIIGEIIVNNCPTTTGLIVHTIIYTLLVRYSMDLNIV